ncbi:hypothetical protein BDP27DRAFT_787230 [Rhodocollybia butyracea]|uniref:RING-type domain-containing protein n=1 Tax=Rhodocollybia butyracea TaxID=206335 RepID=A0A9P5U799_9AGAR|nr:hypothetical protein BDP27DRAFT_787230 [Rhodocollybia butyracea]
MFLGLYLAAATAASLLTGTSDISSLPPTSPDSSRPSAPNNPLLPTTSPSSQSGPSTTENTSSSERAPANTGLGDRDRADRMRQVWSTVRNRLGLQPSNRRNAERRASDVELLANPRDARERMLSEIARAFNLGISASPPSSPSNIATDSESTGSESPTPRRAPGTDALGLPAEGTFERFLLDLQIDLRGVLTGRGIARQPEAVRTEPDSMDNTEGAPTEELSQLDVEPEPEPEDDEETNSTSSMRSSMHNLSDLPVDAESPSSDSTSIGSVGGNATAPPTAVNNVPSSPPNAPNRINYWRLYRFPPIAAPRAHAAAESVAQNMRSGLGGLSRVSPVTRASPLHSPQSPASPPTAGESSADAGSSTQPIQNPPAANTTVNNDVVIPVIIVGLQSVNAIWATESLVPAVAGTNTLAERPNPPVDADTDEARGGNRWPSRAANALRSLRRQSTPTPPTTSLFQDEDVDSSQSVPTGMTSQGTQTQQLPNPTQTATPVPFPDILSAPGSRTFLIYVIGGYYPPDHEIVTGADDSGILDSSFEALLSLNELLNHAESPLTVSKDQLEKSGLEIIQGEQINEWENLGKVRSNCVERCLICLDEYARHDSVRVMECKHAFHMDCVDRWLLECKNSCPACRGKGVEDNEAQPS